MSKRIMELGSNEAIKRAVEVGLGISIISGIVVEREVKAGLLRAIRLSKDRITRKFYIVYHKDKYLSTIIQSLLKMAPEVLNKSIR